MDKRQPQIGHCDKSIGIDCHVGPPELAQPVQHGQGVGFVDGQFDFSQDGLADWLQEVSSGSEDAAQTVHRLALDRCFLASIMFVPLHSSCKFAVGAEYYLQDEHKHAHDNNKSV